MSRHLSTFPLSWRSACLNGWVMTAVVACLGLPMGAVAAETSGTAATPAKPAAPAAAAKPALTVELVGVQVQEWPQRVVGQGSLAAWQEASVGAEGGPWRLKEVLAQVGDRVQRGQTLARFADELVRADLAQAQASLSEAQSLLKEAEARAARARELRSTGVLSLEQTQAALTTEDTARARVQSVQAQVALQQLRVQQTQILAPDDGIVSARSATVGAVVPPGQELFRLIRQGRLEWRAEVPSDDLRAIRSGQKAELVGAGGLNLTGRVRVVAPTIDANTRNGLVYVDLQPAEGARAGMFARGEFLLGAQKAKTLPQSAVQMREGYAVVYTVDAQQRARQVKVATGRRQGDRIEITSGLADDAQVVKQGAGFLADGDAVRVSPAAR
jgi:HlyD family secretion protein